MAMNPMQRRARNSFLIGFLVALIMMAVVVFILLYQMKGIKEEHAALQALQKENVVVAAKNLKSGQTLSFTEDFTRETVRTNVPADTIISSSDFAEIDDAGNSIEKTITLKVDVPAGTIVTKDMINDADEPLTDAQRVQEYNMIVLPSQLVNGDYVDIRLSLPSGQDYIVLSKKEVLGTTETSVWFKMDEEEILSLNNAIVEAYTITGAKLYAIQYTEPGLQDEAIPTYPVSAAVLSLINTDPNIINEARTALWERYNSEIRVNYFDSALEQNIDNQGSLVSSGNSTEVQSIKAARQEFVESLEGTENIGYSR